MPNDGVRHEDLRPHADRRLQGEPQGAARHGQGVERPLLPVARTQILAHADAPQTPGRRRQYGPLLRAGRRLPQRDDQGPDAHHPPGIRTHRQQPRGSLDGADPRPDVDQRRRGDHLPPHQPDAPRGRLLRDRGGALPATSSSSRSPRRSSRSSRASTPRGRTPRPRCST